MWQTSYYQNVVIDTSNRHISVAVSLSVVGHLILFVAVALWIGVAFDQAISSRPLVIIIETQDSDGRVTGDVSGDSKPQQSVDKTGAPDPAKPIAEPIPSRSETKLVRIDIETTKPEYIIDPQQEQFAAASGQTLPDTQDLARPVELSTVQGEMESLERAVVLTTTQTSQTRHQIVTQARRIAEQPTVEKEAMTPRQHKMLDRKIARWAENLYEMEQLEQDLTWQHQGQQYTAKIRRLPAKDDMAIEQIVVDIITEKDGTTMSAEMRLKRLAFSNFTQFVDRWDPSVHLHDDEMDGRFHSNSEISLLTTRGVTPTFHGKVTTVSRQVNMNNSFGSTWRGKVFLGGLETGVKEILLPRHFAPFPDDSDDENDQVQYFNEDTTVRFYRDGSYGWKPANATGPEQKRTINHNTTYLIGTRKTKLFVSGVVKGKILIYTPENLVIEGNLIYAHDPATTPDGDNYLGLVSDKNIEIAAPDITGPGDLTIHASIYAKRRFRVNSFGSRDEALLLVYGSLTAGSLSATEPRYRTRIEFDKRLETKRPPGFPVTNRYEVQSWETNWEIN